MADEEPTVPPPPSSAGGQPPQVEPHGFLAGAGLPIAAFLVMMFGSACAIGLALWLLDQLDASFGQLAVVLPILLILGVVALLGVLGSMVFLFNRAGMPLNPNLPLGLPDGTISAVIALLLIIIFSITSVYLYGSISSAEAEGDIQFDVSAQDLGKIPPDQVISISRFSDNTFTVNRTVPIRASLDLAKQILSVVGTLLVAIVGFYFGQRSAAGKDDRTGARASPERPREPE